MNYYIYPCRPGFRTLAKVILLGLVLAGAADALAPLACAAERRWTGSASAFWSNPNNWDPVGAPQNDEILLFRKDDSNRSMNNDLSGLRIRLLSFGFDGNDSDYELSGNSLRVGTLAVIPDGSASVTINCPLSFTSDGTITVDNMRVGLIFTSTTDLYLNGSIGMSGPLEMVAFESSVGAGHVSRIHIAGPISGGGNLRAGVFLSSDSSQGGSYVEFTGTEPNTFIGTLIVDGTGEEIFASRIYFDKPTGVAVVNDGAKLVIERNAVVHLRSSEQIGDNADVEVRSGGELRLENAIEGIRNLILTDNNRFGNLNQFIDLRSPTVDTGTRLLSLNGGLTCSKNPTNSPDVPSIRGTLNLNGFLPIQITRDFGPGLDIFASVTGGGFSKTGSGSLRLHGANTFTDEVVVNEGIVEVRNNSALGTSAGGVALAGGGLNLRDVTIANEALLVADSSSSLVAFGTCTWSGSITLNRQLTILGDDLHLPGVVSGTGDLVLLGTAIELSGPSPNTFTGATVANCDLLTLNKPGATTAFGGPLLIGQDSFTPKEVRWLNSFQINRVVTPVTLGRLALMNLNGHTEMIGSLEFRGGGSVQNSGASTLTLFQTVTASVATASAAIRGGRLAIAGGQRIFHVEDGALEPDLSITAAIVEAGGITKTGPGTLLLSAANSFAGAVAINEGVVHIQNNTSLGTTGAGTTVRDGATLQIEFVGALAEPLNIRGTGRGGTMGALNLMAATGTGVGTVMAGPSTVRVDVGLGILGGAISGTGPFTKVGAGTLQFGGGGGPANTYTGDTFVEEGILVLSKANGVTTVPGHLIIGGGGGIFGASATVRHFNSFTIGGGVTLNRLGVWDLNGNSESFSVADLQGRPALTLNVGSDVQTGAGTLFLPGDSDVAVNPGTAPGASSFISGHLALEPGSHRFIVQSGASGIGVGVLEFDVSAVISQTAAAADIVKEGPGVMRLGGANSFTGPVTVNEGRLTAAHALALGTPAGGAFVNDNASLALEGGLEIVEALTLGSTNAAALLSLGPVTNIWRANIILQRTAGIRVPDARGGLTHFGTASLGVPAPNISGPGGFTKSGPGALFIGLGGGNSYTGPTTVSDGLLEALRGRSLSSNIVVTGANAVLRTGRTGNQFNGALTVLPRDASVTVQDGALWTMNPTNSETLGRLQGGGRLVVSTAGALTITNVESCTFSGPFSGSGALNKRGPATFHVTGNSPSYTGLATVFDGTYKVDGNFIIGPITVKAGAELNGAGVVGNVVVENGGVVRVDSEGPGQLGGDLVMDSVNFHNGSVLNLGFYGPHPTGGNDRLFVDDTVTLNTPTLSAGFNYPPRDGDVITLIGNTAADAVIGTMSGFPQGALRFIGGIPVVMSYAGGDGNDVTLTVTNLPLRGGGAQLVSGHGGSVLVPNDCSQLRLVVTNRGAVALTGLRGKLRSLTPGVVVTMAESSYADLAPNARGTNATPFQISTEPSFACGGGAEFELILSGSNIPPIAVLYTLAGSAGHALAFNGSGNHVAVPHRAALNAFPLTVTTWVKTTGGSDLVNKYVSSSLNGWNVFMRGGRVRAWYFASNSRFVWDGGDGLDGGPVADGLWHHVAFTVDASGGKIYVDGALKDSRPWTGVPGPATTTQQVRLGINAEGTIPFDGQLDEITIWRAALSQTQIQTNLHRSLTGAEANLLAYYRCDDGSGPAVADGAALDGNNNGAWVGTPLFALSGVAPFSVPGGPDCASGRGACESCFVVSGRFDTNALETVRHLTATGLPSVCDPPKLCPGFDEFTNAPVRHVLHHFTNSTAAELCVTAQLLPGCSSVPANFFGAAAYVGEFRINQPCSNYLGDDGVAGPVPPPFSFRVPPLTNFLLVVTARLTNLVCASYSLELFSLPCPPPRLDIARDAAPDKVRLHWSSAYPDYHLQSVNSLDDPGPHPFNNVANQPVLVGGKFAVTNDVSTTRQFFRLAK